jgi:periplasmic protein TonB
MLSSSCHHDFFIKGSSINHRLFIVGSLTHGTVPECSRAHFSGATMFSTLLESRARPTRRPAATIVSVTAHVGVFATLVAITAGATPRPEEPVEQHVEFVAPPAPPETPRAVPPPPTQSVAVAVPKGFQVLTAPIEIPTEIPPIDLSRGLTREEDFSGRGLPGGRSDGTGTTPVPTTDVPFDAMRVEKAVVALPGAVPSYPDMLRSAGVEGQVMIQFIVDTTGRAEPGSITVLSSTHELFAQSVKNAIPRMRFMPAEIGGRRVRQLVQQPFGFSLHR